MFDATNEHLNFVSSTYHSCTIQPNVREHTMLQLSLWVKFIVTDRKLVATLVKKVRYTVFGQQNFIQHNPMLYETNIFI